MSMFTTDLDEVDGGYYDLADLGASLRFSLDGGTTWQVRPFGS